MIARRSLCPEKLGSNPGQGSKEINLLGWHGLDMSHYCDKEILNSNQTETTGPISPMNRGNNVDVQHALYPYLDPSMTAGQGHKIL